MDIGVDTAAAGQYFVGADKGQRGLWIGYAAGIQAGAAGAAIAAAALVGHLVAGAFQCFEQGFARLQFKAGAVGGD